MTQSENQLHPAAAAVIDRFQKLLDQGKVCPACGGELEIEYPTKSGMYENEPCVWLSCKLNERSTKAVCWDWDGDDDFAIEYPDLEGAWLEFVETGSYEDSAND